MRSKPAPAPDVITLRFVKVRPGDEPTDNPAADTALLLQGAAIIARAYLDSAQAINVGGSSDDVSLGRELNVLHKRFEKLMKRAGTTALLNGYTLEVGTPPAK